MKKTASIAATLSPLSIVRRAHADMNMLSPQAVRVLEHLEKTGSITNVEAHAVLKVRSVSRRITELTDAGFDIERSHKRDSTGQRYVQYVLI